MKDDQSDITGGKRPTGRLRLSALKAQCRVTRRNLLRPFHQHGDKPLRARHTIFSKRLHDVVSKLARDGKRVILMLPTLTDNHVKYWWVFALLSCSQLSVADPRIIVIGDSISEHVYCWPSQLREESPHLNLQLMTQAGRNIRDFSIPRDLRNVSKEDVVIYFLGTNDAHGGYPMRYVSEGFVSHMVFLKERGFKVAVLLPPAASALMPEIEHVRTVIRMQSVRLGIEHYDLEFWDESMTKDGIHPGPELSRFIADFVYSLLEPGMQTGSLEIGS
jgi:hypothetical protein